jgi:hypothetical protein
MSFNSYMAHAVRAKRIEKLMAQKYRCFPTARLDDHKTRESREQAKHEERCRELPRYRFEDTKWVRVLHPRVS